jgi:hypothetical protein
LNNQPQIRCDDFGMDIAASLDGESRRALATRSCLHDAAYEFASKFVSAGRAFVVYYFAVIVRQASGRYV